MSMPRRRATDERTWSASSVLAFDLAALQHVVGQREKNGLLPDLEAERLHLADQPALKVSGCRQGCRQVPVVPHEPRPVRKIMDI